ncbi:related to transcription factor SPT8 [Rhynchosporium secalis]|uniref:Related to transcription factor SPT8 n=1 Tax=Rhynchosporium secalis TaxID=38038 RepID=A0A1E1LVL5_RHYSE|nr:related to transcription factor SPT8 [Rhynchosporium secalis]
MPDFGLDDDDRGSNGSSDNEQDELNEDVDDNEGDGNMDVDGDDDGDGDADGDGDGDGDGDEDRDGDDDDEDNENDNRDDDQDMGDEDDDAVAAHPRRPSMGSNPTGSSSDDTPTINQVNGGPTSHPRPVVTRTSASPTQNSPPLPSPKMRFEVRAEALTASSYDIVPTMAAPQSTSINAITATPDMRFWFSGGSDCYIRKYDGAATVNGKTLLTVAQRHPFVDSVVKAGVLMSYWDNEEVFASKPSDDPPFSPVYSLAVESQALWMLSGLESGAINLYSVRHDEGKRIAYMLKHKSAVSVLTLARDERSVLSGSWDKNIFDWDLNTGQSKRGFEGSGGQISAIEIRPASSLPVPEEFGEPIPKSETLSSNNDKPFTNGNGINGTHGAEPETEDAPGSPSGSLFGGGSDNDSLFGETAGEGAPSGGVFGDDDDEFSRAIGSSIEKQETLDAQGDISMGDAPIESEKEPEPELEPETKSEPEVKGHHAEEEPSKPMIVAETQDAVATSDSTFLAASTDGTMRIWDRRQPDPVARISTRIGVPPWCMAACWSPDGNFVYAGRRNGTVEEFSLHKGLKTPSRTFKFPQGSGAVSAIRAMPNGRHLICASHDILRLYDLKEPQSTKHSTVPFLIVPGPPRGGVISALHIDPTCRYMLSAAGNRGWEGSSTEVLIGYEIGIPP